MRVSHFTILVELNNKYWLLFNGYYGVWDIITPEVAAVFNNSKFDKLTSEQLLYAVSRNYLTESSLEDEIQDAINAGANLRKKEKHIASIVFAITIGCNLACSYCFQTKLRDKNKPILMTHKQVDAVYQSLDELIAKNSIKIGNICLFGGEPLMEDTVEISTYIINQAKKRGLSVSAITNGVELSLFKNHFGNPGLSSLGITIDGPARIHDLLRRRIDGTGTFNDIVDNIELALCNNVFIKLRVNIDNVTLTALPELMDYCNGRGWFDTPRFGACVGFIDKPGQSAYEYEAIRKRTAKILYSINEKYGRMVISIFEGTTGNRINAVLSQQTWGRVPVKCRSQLNNYIFAPDGKIYACWRMIGEGINKLGTYEPELNLDSETVSQWFDRSSIYTTKCKDCAHMFSCGGGCAKLAITDPILDKSYCKSFEILLKSELRSQFIGRIANISPLCY